MHRIDSPGATLANLFTEGNPSLNIPATEVSDDWLNDVQEEIANLIENQDIALVKGDQTQLEAAINLVIQGGGGDIKLDPLLNNTPDQVIAGLVFDKLSVKAVMVYFDIHRRTDSGNEQEIGILGVTHDSEDDAWRITTLMSGLDDTGSTFNIVVGTGQIRVSTIDLVGAAYAAQIRITGITTFKL